MSPQLQKFFFTISCRVFSSPVPSFSGNFLRLWISWATSVIAYLFSPLFYHFDFFFYCLDFFQIYIYLFILSSFVFWFSDFNFKEKFYLLF